jgi:hypothetical protein
MRLPWRQGRPVTIGAFAPWNPRSAGAGVPGNARFHIVATCTKRKRQSALPELRLREYRQVSIAARLTSWIGALAHPGSSNNVTTPEKLYAGDHWHIARSLPGLAEAQGVSARLWVCSAGYGLIPADAAILPYSATFSTAHPDSVWKSGHGLSRAQAVAEWWSGLTKWDGPVLGAPRSIQGLAAADPGVAIWVIASETYLRAMRADILAATETLKHREYLALFSAGTRRLIGLEAYQLAFDSRLQGPEGPLGGAAMSLNVRVARMLIEHGFEPDVSTLNARLRENAAPIRPRVRKMGEKVSAAVVESFLREELARNAAASKTALLRKLRDERAWAFEEKRFGRLFAQVQAEIGNDAREAHGRTRRSREPKA